MEWYVIGAMLLVCYLALRRDIKALKPKKRDRKKTTAVKGPEMVYILANPSFRNGIFKIGLTKRTIATRMRELFTTGLPTPFVECVTIETKDCVQLEKDLHTKFARSRVSDKREFFKLTMDDIVGVVRDQAYARWNSHAVQAAVTGEWYL